ncbi:arsenate reductase (glutaredoxin) [Rhodobacteraceae bacterium]|nr:arsenate reductase (glutaredoxin) [Paracoccaceae bacterium]
MVVTIWHNPRCSKSRATLALLQARGIVPMIRLYLDDPPTREELEGVLRKLDLPARSLLRASEARSNVPALADHAQILASMAANPALIERPVVMTAHGARIGRPPEAVLDLF